MKKQEYELARQQTAAILGGDNSGHSMDHIDRVLKLSEQFMKYYPQADRDVVRLTALLHDVDDYKINNGDDVNLPNAHRILNMLDLQDYQKEKIISAIQSIGYSKRLKGISPQSLEAMIVSDADMCDASGASGIIRAQQYASKFNAPFFDRQIWPMEEIDLKFYRSAQTTTVNHLFEKILRLKDLMLTEPGRREGLKRHQTVVTFLQKYFREQNCRDWLAYLNEFEKRHA